MGKKKPIDCPEILGGCGAICVEVGRAIGYPKPIQDCGPRVRTYHEYRYVCPDCGKEWLHDTLFNEVGEITDAQFPIKIVDGREVIEGRTAP